MISKVILGVLQHDIMKAYRPLQVCAGQGNGCEAAIHAMHQLFFLPMLIVKGHWWDLLLTVGKRYGYYPNIGKNHVSDCEGAIF